MSDEQVIRHYSNEDKTRLIKLINDGCGIMQEVEDLTSSLNDTIKAVAEEVGIKPSQLKKAMKIAYKNTLHEEEDKMTEIRDILETIGRV